MGRMMPSDLASDFTRHVDVVPDGMPPLAAKARLIILEDNDAAVKICLKVEVWQ